jgi:hypothetical protein
LAAAICAWRVDRLLDGDRTAAAGHGRTPRSPRRAAPAWLSCSAAFASASACASACSALLVGACGRRPADGRRLPPTEAVRRVALEDLVQRFVQGVGEADLVPNATSTFCSSGYELVAGAAHVDRLHVQQPAAERQRQQVAALDADRSARRPRAQQVQLLRTRRVRVEVVLHQPGPGTTDSRGSCSSRSLPVLRSFLPGLSPASASTARNPVSTSRAVPAGMNVELSENVGAFWSGICSVR